MYSGDFLKALEELHDYRGVPITEIARELGVSRQLIYDLKKNRKRITPRVLKRAEIALPELLLRNPRLKPPGVYFLEDVEEAPSIPARDKNEDYRFLRERLSGVHSKPVDDTAIRVRIKEEEMKQARERYKVWLENLAKHWWGLK